MIAAVVVACFISGAHGLWHTTRIKRMSLPIGTAGRPIDLPMGSLPWPRRTSHNLFARGPQGARPAPFALDNERDVRVTGDARHDSRRHRNGTARSPIATLRGCNRRGCRGRSVWQRPTHGSLSDAEASDIAPLFYMYEPLPWMHDCNTSWTSLHAPQNEAVDLLIHRVLEHHPWRTSDPKKAHFFFVPAYVSMSRVNKCGNHSKNMESTAQMLLESPHFKQNSSFPNHLIAAFEFGSKEDTLGALGALTKSMIVCHYEKKDFDHPLVVPYAGQYGSEYLKLWQRKPSTSWTELSARKHSLFFVGQVDHRQAYRERRIMMLYLPAAFPDSILIKTPKVGGQEDNNFTNQWPTLEDPIEFHAEIPDCELLNLTTGCSDHRLFQENYTDLGKQAKFNMVVHGDTPSTSRLYDAFEFGQIPIIISKGFREIAMPFGQELPWHDFAVFVRQSDFTTDPVASITEAVNKADHKKMFESLKRARKAVDWYTDPDCIGTALLSSVARNYVGFRDLPPALSSKSCE